MYQREFFDLQLEFARRLVEKHGLAMESALFNNTALYTRIIGHSDDVAPQEDNEIWQELMTAMPRGDDGLNDYFYNAYLQAEQKKRAADSEQKLQENAGDVADGSAAIEPCFHAYYRPELDAYQLHLDVNDELGVLSKNRIEARLAELRSMLSDIKVEARYQEDTVLYVETWLLNIVAFNRLFPRKFSDNANLLQNGNKSQDNAHWGQFLTRDKQLRAEVVEKFRRNLQVEEQTDFNLYFPYPAKYAQMKLTELMAHYL